MILSENIRSLDVSADRAIAIAAGTDYQPYVSDAAEDPAWDAFVAAAPGGPHVQASIWARVKALLGWRIVRIVVMRGDQIVAGAQVLIRPLPIAGAVGYVPRGPLVASDDPALADLIVTALRRVAWRQRIHYLIVQPPCDGAALTHRLPRAGFRPCSIEVAPAATVRVDLTQDLDAILAQMKGKTRYNIRLGQRKGITVREGTECDLHIFYQMLQATGQRQGFSIYPEAYFGQMWSLLAPHGHMRLFLAEYAGEAISGLLALAFGSTVTYWRGAWVGQHGGLHPNEAMHWAAISWAKSQGYHYYDLEGIDPKVAGALLDGAEPPDSRTQTLTSYKIGFGGQIILFPQAHDYIPNPALRWAYNQAFSRIASSSLLGKITNIVRGIRSDP